MRAFDRHVGDVALDLVAGVRQLDDEGRILLVARRVRIGLGHHQRHVGDAGGGGKPLLAVEDVVLVAVLHRRGLHAGGVGAGGLLGHREADALVAVEQGFEELFLLIFRAVGEDRHHRGVVGPLRVHRQRAEHALAELHLHQRVGERTEPHAAIFLRHPRAPQAAARGPLPAAGPALRRAAWCRVPFPPGCIRHAPICGPSRGSPWLRPGFRNRSTWWFPRFLFLLVGLEGWHKPATCQRQRQTKFEARLRIRRTTCGRLLTATVFLDSPSRMTGVRMPDLADLFPGYASEWINTSSGRIFARVGGKGPPLLLLHGFSSTHVMWHPVAPQLADKFTLIIADLPGYGWSDMPDSDDEPHALHQARDGEGDGGGDGATRPCAFRARRSRPRRPRVLSAGARSSRPAVEARGARYRCRPMITGRS